MSMSPPGYNAETDLAAKGSVLCDDCGRRVHPKTLETLPEHGCAAVQQANRYLLAMVVQHRVRRDALGNVWVLSGPNICPPREADRFALARLLDADMIQVSEGDDTLEPYYEITDRALV